MNAAPRLRATSLALLTAAAVTVPWSAAAPAGAAITDVCGAFVADYNGHDVTDTPFVGTLNRPGGIDDAMMMIPSYPGVNFLRVETIVGSSDDRMVIDNYRLDIDSTGRGIITFSTPLGDGVSRSLSCEDTADPTRVTKIVGELSTETGTVQFTVART